MNRLCKQIMTLTDNQGLSKVYTLGTDKAPDVLYWKKTHDSRQDKIED